MIGPAKVRTRESAYQVCHWPRRTFCLHCWVHEGASLVERQIPVRELNQHTSAVLDRVAKGQAVTITRDGRPIARLVPVAGASSFLDGLVAQGLARAPVAHGPLCPPPNDPGTVPSVADLLVHDREQERG